MGNSAGHRLTVGFLFLLSVCFELGLDTAGFGQAASSAAGASEVKVALGVENLEPTGAATSFDIDAGTKLYIWARVADLPSGGNVTLAFKKGDIDVYHREVSIPSTPYRIYAYRIFRAGDSGDWSATLSGPDGKELASAAVKVTVK